MANSIKRPSDGLAYQITRPAREAGLVEENEEGDASYLATVRVHAVDGLLLIVDVDDLTNEEEGRPPRDGDSGHGFDVHFDRGVGHSLWKRVSGAGVERARRESHGGRHALGNNRTRSGHPGG